jgi:hypothetical protein
MRRFGRTGVLCALLAALVAGACGGGDAGGGRDDVRNAGASSPARIPA